MTTTVSDYRRSKQVIELDFGWTPYGLHHFPGPNNTTLVAPDSTAGVVLTFTATTKVDYDNYGYLTFTEYRWDFGDGVIAYGNPVQHTYIIGNFNIVTALRLTDSYGTQWYARHQMYVGPASLGRATLPLCFTR